MSDEDTPDREERAREAKRVLRNREMEALDAGMSAADAYLFAVGEGDIAELRHLIELDCPEDLLSEILL